MRRVLTGIGAVLLLAACGGSSSSGTKTISLTRAAYVSSASSGYKALMSVQETVPGLGEVNLNGNGSFSASSHTGSMTMQMTLPGAVAQQAGVGNVRLQAVMVPGTIYMKLPPQLAEKIPGGKPWWQINLSQAGKLAGVPGLSSLLSGTSNVNDPGQYLDFLRATSNGSVKDFGPATVDGVQTTHYHALVDLSKLPNAVPARDRAATQQLVATLKQRGALTNGLPIDVWIDSSNLIRQIELSFSQPLGTGASASVAVKMNFLQYGPQPAPAVPPAGQTFNLLSLLGSG